MRLESRTTQGDWSRVRRSTFPSMALSESDLGDFISQVSPSMEELSGRSLALLARPIHEHYVVASEGEGLGRFHLVRPYVGFSSECYVPCATFHALRL